MFYHTEPKVFVHIFCVLKTRDAANEVRRPNVGALTINQNRVLGSFVRNNYR